MRNNYKMMKQFIKYKNMFLTIFVFVILDFLKYNMLEENLYITYHDRECFFVFLLFFMIIFPLHTFLDMTKFRQHPTLIFNDFF